MNGAADQASGPRRPARPGPRVRPRSGRAAAARWGSASAGWWSACSHRARSADRSASCPASSSRQDQHIHARTLTRYRERGGTSQNAEGAGARGGGAPGRGVSGHGAGALRPAARDPLPAPGGHHPVGAVHRRAGQHGDARPSSRPIRMPAALARADPEKVEEIIRSTGFFRAKTRSLIGMASALEERFGGQVPTELADLVTVPGVGRKTGNVVRSVAFGSARASGRHARPPGLQAVGAHRARRPGQGRAGAQRAHPGRRARRLQPPGDPARAGDLYGPPTCLCGAASWPISARRRSWEPARSPGASRNSDKDRPTCRTIGKRARLQCSLEPVPATWFHKGSSLGSASRTTRRCRPSGVGIGNSQAHSAPPGRAWTRPA